MQPGRDATAPDGLGRVDVEAVASQLVERGFELAGWQRGGWRSAVTLEEDGPDAAPPGPVRTKPVPRAGA